MCMSRITNKVMKWFLVFAMAILPAAMAAGVEMKLAFPQGRAAFQTNELIDVSIVRSGEGELPAGNLTLVLANEQSTMTFVFGLPAGNGSATDHLRLNGWLIAPGAYTLTATLGGATDKADIEVYSHIRKSTYRTIHWGGPHGEAMKGEGENGLGFNLIMGGVDEWSIREGMDIMGITAMGGMHQHDGNYECDWSDPNVYIGAIQRGMDRSLPFRTMPNMIGVQVHDEPGLTHAKHPRLTKDGEPVWGPHDVAPQRAGYERAYGQPAIWLDEVDVDNPERLAAWTHVNDFKLGYMDAFWKATYDAIGRIKPGALAVTQSMYGWAATFDGYYFNVARSMPVICGHGGYNDFWLKNFNPSFFLEMALPRQLDKPTWYLPTWYDISSEMLKFENYMTFITGVQGTALNPSLTLKSVGAPGVREFNHVAARLGTIFAKPAYTRQDVAILFSKSDIYYNKDIRPTAIRWTYLASKLTQYPVTVVLEEDVLDGTVAASHKAVIVVGVTYLDPGVIDALADFAKNGGLVLVGDEVPVVIPGATKLGFKIYDLGEDLRPGWEAATAGLEDGDEKAQRAADATGMMAIYKVTRPLADALQAKLAAAKIAPAFCTDNSLIVPGRQVRGEIEYVFAVNGTMVGHVKSGAGLPGPATATITLPDDGRPIYDAMKGGEMTFTKGKNGVSATFDFGGGDMVAFARPARPIGGVRVSAPVVNFDLTREGQSPIQMNFAAMLMDTNNNIISGAAPMQIVVKDPSGKIRYDLFRATDAGVCTLTLPLAANDPAGTWTVTVTDLLANTRGDASFEFKPLTRARTLAGAVHRAMVFGDDKANIYRFFRDHRVITIAVGDSDYNRAAAERLVKILKPYNITATIVKANEVPARELTAEEAHTWCGTVVSGALRGVKPGRENPPQNVGWDLPNPTIVLGTPEDNVMIQHMTTFQERNVLPYKPGKTFPGKGKGMVAWNLYALGHDVQSLVCIAYDAEGMSQAVGTLFELGVGLDPLLPLALPSSAVVEMAK